MKSASSRFVFSTAIWMDFLRLTEERPPTTLSLNKAVRPYERSRPTDNEVPFSWSQKREVPHRHKQR
jgi:hypothetical protein